MDAANETPQRASTTRRPFWTWLKETVTFVFVGMTIGIALLVAAVWVAFVDPARGELVLGLGNLMVAVGLLAATAELRKIEGRRDEVQFAIDGLGVRTPLAVDQTHFDVFFSIVNRGGRPSAIWETESYVMGASEPMGPKVTFQTYLQEEINNAVVQPPTGTRMRPGIHDHVISPGQRKTFVARFPFKDRVAHLDGRTATITITPVIGKAVTGTFLVS